MADDVSPIIAAAVKREKSHKEFGEEYNKRSLDTTPEGKGKLEEWRKDQVKGEENALGQVKILPKPSSLWWPTNASSGTPETKENLCTPDTARYVPWGNWVKVTGRDKQHTMMTDRAGPCLIIAAYNPTTQTAAMAHENYNSPCAVAQMLDEVAQGAKPGTKIAVYLAGGNDKRMLLDAIYLIKSDPRFEIKSADVQTMDALAAIKKEIEKLDDDLDTKKITQEEFSQRWKVLEKEKNRLAKYEGTASLAINAKTGAVTINHSHDKNNFDQAKGELKAPGEFLLNRVPETSFRHPVEHEQLKQPPHQVDDSDHGTLQPPKLPAAQPDSSPGTNSLLRSKKR